MSTSGADQSTAQRLPLTSNFTFPAAFTFENDDRIQSSVDQMNNGDEQCHNDGRKMLDRNTNDLCRKVRRLQPSSALRRIKR